MANMDIANPSEEHQMLREMVREWTQEHVEPQEPSVLGMLWLMENCLTVMKKFNL